MRLFVALTVATLPCVGAPVRAAENLDCVDSGYNAPDQARFGSFVKGFDLVAWAAQGPPADIMQILTTRVSDCAKSNGWSEAAARYAMAFKMARVGLAGAEGSGLLNANDLAALRKSITPADFEKGKFLFGQMSAAHRSGAKMPSESPDMFVGRLIMRSGVPAERATAAGAWIGATIMSTHFAELFGAA